MLFNVDVTFTTTMVVEAVSEDEARRVARAEALQAVRDANEAPSINVTGEVSSLRQLRNGWDGVCVPYGGDGNTRLSELLPPMKPTPTTSGSES